jgi:hypothetical protein
MEESPDFMEMFIECRIKVVLTVRGCFDPPRRTQHDVPVRIVISTESAAAEKWRYLLTIGKFS